MNRRAKLLTSRAQFHDYLDHIKDLEKNVNLRIQIQARLDGLQRQGQEREHRARVRVRDRAFPGTIVQVGSVSRTLDKVIRRASIRIAENGRLLRVGSIE